VLEPLQGFPVEAPDEPEEDECRRKPQALGFAVVSVERGAEVLVLGREGLEPDVLVGTGFSSGSARSASAR
jgi:hypothetical protein